MACASCGNAAPSTPYAREGFPTVWEWVRPTPDLVALYESDAIAAATILNGPVT